MPRFAANLTMMYTEWAFLERFQAAADDGFCGVEYLFPYAHTPDQIATALQRSGLTQVLFNLDPGDWERGERGLAVLPDRQADFRASVQQALVYAQATGCTRLHVMSGIAPADRAPADTQALWLDNLRYAIDTLGAQGITVMIEPINTRDMPGYFLTHQQQAHDLCERLDSAHVQLQMDLYHCQIMEGDLTRRLERHRERLGHVQIAGVPDRHEPDSGEVAYAHVFEHLDQWGYAGWVGCEYRPRAGTREGLAWLQPWLPLPSAT